MAFHGVTIIIQSKKGLDDAWLFNVHVYDYYDFEREKLEDAIKEAKNKIKTVGSIAATAAWLEQEHTKGMKKYKIDVYYTLTVKR